METAQGPSHPAQTGSGRGCQVRPPTWASLLALLLMAFGPLIGPTSRRTPAHREGLPNVGGNSGRFPDRSGVSVRCAQGAP